jgi:glycosyltransferase involved in cell wall biosynthesis
LTVIQQCRQLEKFLNVPLKPVQRPLTLAAYGRFYPQKGFDDLLKAMNLLPSELVNLHLGGEGSQEEELKQLAEGLNNTKLFGTVTDVPAFLEQCDAVVIPSRWEPWGIVCIEAKAAGKPVIAADIDGLTEQVKDCDCGILVPPHDFQQLADGIASFCNQSERTLETWGRAGRESVKNAWEKYLDNWQALLWNVIKA